MLLRKSQLGMTDLFMAISIFFVVFGMLVFSWNWYSEELTKKVAYKDLQIKVFQVSELLVKTPGAPSLWEKMPNSNNIETLGLAKDYNIISSSKIAKLTDTNFITDIRIKEILNIEIYNFYFGITEEDGSPKYEGSQKIERGQQPITNKSVASIRRPILYENEEDRAILEFALWEK